MNRLTATGRPHAAAAVESQLAVQHRANLIASSLEGTYFASRRRIANASAHQRHSEEDLQRVDSDDGYFLVFQSHNERLFCAVTKFGDTKALVD